MTPCYPALETGEAGHPGQTDEGTEAIHITLLVKFTG